MEPTIGLYWGYIGMMEKRMETTIMGLYRGGRRKIRNMSCRSSSKRSAGAAALAATTTVHFLLLQQLVAA